MSVPYRGNYIQGRFARPFKGVELVSEDPGDLLLPVGKLIVWPEEVDEAVRAAKKAFVDWSHRPLAARIRKLRDLKKVLLSRREFLIHLVAQEAGKPLAESRREVERLADKIDEMIGEGLRFVQDFSVKVMPKVTGECRFRPLGALAVIGPFNFPVHTPASHIVPALLTGNTVVFKPSEYTPFVGQALADCIDQAGFPPGVFNLVQGGSQVGQRLVAHPGISGVLFTGSTAVGQAIKKATLDRPQVNLAMEMGGKNAALVLADADLDLASREIALSAFSMAGQRCNATSRIIVHRKVAKPFLEKFLSAADRVKIGYPLEEGVVMGPLVSHEAVAKFQRYMKLAEEEGFETLRPGKALGRWEKRRGYYVTPGVHLCQIPRKNRSAHYRREEIFGPDVAIYLTRDDEEAVEINNEVPYGLITAVFTRSPKHFEKIYRSVDTGMVNLNRGTIFSSGRLPFGGTKASGSFRPAGILSGLYCTYPAAVLKDSRPLSERSLPL